MKVVFTSFPDPSKKVLASKVKCNIVERNVINWTILFIGYFKKCDQLYERFMPAFSPPLACGKIKERFLRTFPSPRGQLA